MRKRLAIPALLVAGLLVFAACGDDDDSNAGDVAAADDADTEDRSTDDAADEAGDATDEAADDAAAAADEAADEATGNSDGGGDEEFSGDGSGDFCRFMADAQDEVEFDGLGENLAGEDLKEQFDQARDAIDEAVDRAPDEIRGDMELMSDVFVQLDEMLAEYDYDFMKLVEQATEDPEAFAEFEALASDPRFTEASERIDAYMRDVCGIDTTVE